MVKKIENKGLGTGILFVPAGILVGIGIGIISKNLPGGLFVGMGSGFFGFALTEILYNK